MLDIAEAIFIKISELMTKNGRTIRGIFSKYAVPEIFPDRTVLELLSPAGFLEGIRDVGMAEMQEFEVACLMRVLAKPELDNAVILNEFVMIMENFGVIDDGEDSDDYIPDTEPSVCQSTTDLKAAANTPAASAEDDDEIEDEIGEANAETDAKTKKEGSKEEEKKEEKKDQALGAEESKGDKTKKKSQPRQHNLGNIDAKGIKILRKVARFLLKQFLHPREFFGKAVSKE